jgi:hypothetical protein
MANNRNQHGHRVREYREREVEVEARQDTEDAIRQRRRVAIERQHRSREACVEAAQAAATNPESTFVSGSDDEIDRRAV